MQHRNTTHGLNHRINSVLLSRIATARKVDGGRVRHCDVISDIPFFYISHWWRQTLNIYTSEARVSTDHGIKHNTCIEFTCHTKGRNLKLCSDYELRKNTLYLTIMGELRGVFSKLYSCFRRVQSEWLLLHYGCKLITYRSTTASHAVQSALDYGILRDLYHWCQTQWPNTGYSLKEIIKTDLNIFIHILT